MTRWLGAIVAALLVIAAGYLLFLNPEPVVVRLTPERTMTWPLAGALLAAFAAGGVVVAAIAAVRAGARGWRSWRADRAARRETRRAEAVARAQHLAWSGDYAQARTELLRGEDDVPTDVGRLVLLAETHLAEGDGAGARKILDAGIHRVGLAPRLLDLLAEAAERSGDLRGAADALERARVGQPDSPRLARRLRDVYAAAGRWSEALELQGQILLRTHDAVTLAREEQMMRGLRYQAALAERDALRAARVLLGIAREDPTFVPAWVSAGDFFVRAGRSLTARRLWERGARHRPAVALLERLERLTASEGKPDRMARVYRRLQRRHPENPAVAFMFARSAIARGALDQAAEILEALPASLAGQPIAHALWGEVHRRRGNHSLAADTYARAYGTDLGLAGPFRCMACGHPADSWTGYCPSCRRWGTYEAPGERVQRAVTVAPATQAAALAAPNR